MQESSLLLERQGKVEAFYYRTDIIYTMPGTKNEIVILDNLVNVDYKSMVWL